MKRSTKSFTKASKLYQSIHQQLSMCAVASVVALVSMLALTQPSEAKIVYTPTHVVVENETYKIDLNHDGIFDVAIVESTHNPVHCELVAFPAQGNGIEEGTQIYWAAALKAGANIGYTKQFNPLDGLMALAGAGGPGYWRYKQARYLGMEFQISGKTHFGWARFTNSSCFGATLTGYAYETIAGKSIKAGQKKEATDESSDEDFGPGASLTNPIPDSPQPASLGMLALGAQGVPLRRRKESALETL